MCVCRDNWCDVQQTIPGIIDQFTPTGKTDSDLLIEAMKLKKLALSRIFEARAFYFLIESEFKSDKWVTIDEFDSIPNNFELRLIITKCPTFEIDSQSQETQKLSSSNDSDNWKFIIVGMIIIKTILLSQILNRFLPVPSTIQMVFDEYKLYS